MSAIGITICTLVNFVFFFFILWITLAVQKWSNGAEKNLTAIQEVLKTMLNQTASVNNDVENLVKNGNTPYKMLENPNKHEIGESLKCVFEKRTPKQITATDRSNQAKIVNALQNAFDMRKIEYEEANSLANWLDNLVNNQIGQDNHANFTFGSN